MELLFAFTLADRDHFEPISRRPVARQFFEHTRPLLPEDWTLARGGMWLMATGPDVHVPEQGFKIHLSATVDNAIDVISRVVPACVSAGAAFKVIADVNLLYIAGSKNFGRGSSSKFITIYPPSQDTFTDLIETVHVRTRDVDGPYILSDARYKDSRVVFYRYGGFQLKEVVNITGGRDTVIRAPDGRQVPDQRLPFYQLPPWVRDPYGNEPVLSYEGRHTLQDERYDITGSLAFSNRGGVYSGKDTHTGMPVVIKEARRLTATWNGDGKLMDAVSMLRREHAMLTELRDLDFVPKAVDLFEEWEHLFLVQELVVGVPLTRYRARHEVTLVPFTGEPEKTRNFCTKFRTIASQLLAMVRELHGLGIVLGDLSPSNVLIDPETMRLRMIDLEAAKRVEEARNAGKLWAAWAAQGFASPKRAEGTGLSPTDDLYALGMILYSLIIPVQPLFQFEPAAFDRLLERVNEVTPLPWQIPGIIKALVAGDGQGAADALDGWNAEETPGETPAPRARTDDELEADVGDLASITRRIAEHILSTTDCGRSDRLWPADFSVFRSNPLSVAFGACGPALFLRDVYGEIPNDVDEWLLKQRISVDKYPPGLYVGTAGIAQAMLELGHGERAAEIMEMTHSSPLWLSDPTMFHGAAGIGMALLHFCHVDPRQRWLDRAVEIGDYLMRTAEPRGEGCCWRNSVDGGVHFGLGYGASGIALFLLRLGELTGDPRLSAVARRGMAFDLAGAVDFAGTPKWVRFEGDSLTEPYWLHGAAGVGTASIRFAAALGDSEFAQWAEQAATSAFSRLAATPGQLEGLSGMAELMLDMYQLTGNALYRTKAFDLARSILCFRVERPTGLAFPGRQLVRLSADYAFGAAGVGAFLHRLHHGTPRRFHDVAPAGAQVAAEYV